MIWACLCLPAPAVCGDGNSRFCCRANLQLISSVLLLALYLLACMQLLNNLPQQLANMPLAASPGSVHCLLLHLLPTAKAAAPVSMGSLKLSWRRKSPASVGSAAAERRDSSSGGSGGGSSCASAAAAAAVMAAGPAPGLDVETSLELPLVVVQESLLSVKAAGPQNVTAGTSFPYTLQVSTC